MFGLGMGELVVILIVALIVFGPGKLPEVGKALGRGISEFRRAANGESEVSKQETIKMEVPAEKRNDV